MHGPRKQTPIATPPKLEKDREKPPSTVNSVLPSSECCTYPVLEPVNVMAQFHPDNFCDPGSVTYRDKYAEIARRPTHEELDRAWRRARELGLRFETTTFERRSAFCMPAILEI
jgi:putative pyruvate formate lyase activating enzyme